LWRPLTKEALGGFTLRFVKEQIELTCGGVGIHLVIPSLLFACAEPLDEAPVFCGGQTVDGGLDLLNSAHALKFITVVRPVWRPALPRNRTEVRSRSGDFPPLSSADSDALLCSCGMISE